MNFFGTSYPAIYIEKSTFYKYDHVFLLPPWKEIYKTDEERYESFEHSLAIYEHLKNTYLELNYTITEVPIGKVEDRVNYILNHLRLL